MTAIRWLRRHARNCRDQTPAQFAEYQRNYMKLASIDEAIASSIAERSSLSDAGATAEFAAQLLLLDLRPQLPAIKVPVVEISPFHAPDLARDQRR